MRAFDAVLVGIILFNGVVFGGLGAWSLRASHRTDSPQFASLGGLVALVCGALVLGSVHRLGVQAHRLGWVAEDLGSLLLTDLHMAKSLLATVFAVAGFRVALGIKGSLEQMQRVTAALLGRAVGMKPISVATFNLTDRETEVMSLIKRGCLKDEDIATTLQISRHTARTHVRNILRKTGLESRRELLLVSNLPQDAVPSGRTGKASTEDMRRRPRP